MRLCKLFGLTLALNISIVLADDYIPPYWDTDTEAYYVPTNMQCLYDNKGHAVAIRSRTIRIDGVKRYIVQGNNIVTEVGAIKYCNRESKKHWLKANRFADAENRIKSQGVKYKLLSNSTEYKYLNEEQKNTINNALLHMAEAAMPGQSEKYPIFNNKKCDLVEEVFFKEYKKDNAIFGYKCVNKKIFYIKVLHPF